MIIERKEAKKEFGHITTISRHYIRYLIWDCLAKIIVIIPLML